MSKSLTVLPCARVSKKVSLFPTLPSDRLRLLHRRPEVLHVNFYELSGGLDASAISSDLSYMAELMDLLQPLTG